jgi:hypothetical protein
MTLHPTTHGWLTAISRTSSATSTIDSAATDEHGRLHVLIVTTPNLWMQVIPPIAGIPTVDVQVFCPGLPAGCLKNLVCWDESVWEDERDRHAIPDFLCKWAHILILAPLDANRIAKMLCGICDDTILAILRGWDVSKSILLVPSMSMPMWSSPMTKKHLSKIRRKWTWIRVYPPAFIIFEKPQEKPQISWDGADAIAETIKNGIVSRDFTQGTPVLPDETRPATPAEPHRARPSLPPELWSLILEYVGDWEVATALNIYAKLPTPPEWRPFLPRGSKNPRSLEYTILTGSFPAIRNHLSLTQPPLKSLSRLASKLIIKFARTDILTHLSLHHKDIFWSTFGLTLLPTKASAIYGKPEILTWWLHSPAVLKKEYTDECVDGASRAGFVRVLDWWRNSGLPMRYTEKSLEQASANGHVDVLEWWKTQSRLPITETTPSLPLKIGKSIVSAAQAGRTNSLLFWHASSLPYSHEESVAKIASTHGHVPVLSLWLELKGSKMIFDVSVLVGATKNGHTDVLEWWKRSGLRVEFRTCDIEEAIEDCVGGGAKGEERVREWWGRNGLNLGVGTSEWMKVKVL